MKEIQKIDKGQEQSYYDEYEAYVTEQPFHPDIYWGVSPSEEYTMFYMYYYETYGVYTEITQEQFVNAMAPLWIDKDKDFFEWIKNTDSQSMVLSFIPGIGEGKDLQEAIFPFDLVTGERLTTTQHIFSMIAVLVPLVGGKALREGVEQAVKHSDEVMDTLKKYDEMFKGTVKAYGGLEYAADYGLDTYKNLKKSLKGTGLQAHHIIEKRLKDVIGVTDSNLMQSVAVTKAEHQVFTNAWRDAIPYGTDYSTLSKDYIWEVAQDIYKDYPELLDAAQKSIFH